MGCSCCRFLLVSKSPPLTPPLRGEGKGSAEPPAPESPPKARLIHKKLLLSGDNQEHLYLCANYSAFRTNSSSWVLILSPKGTKDHRRGRKPPVKVQRKRKPRGGDRNRCKLKLNKLHILPPFRGQTGTRTSRPRQLSQARQLRTQGQTGTRTSRPRQLSQNGNGLLSLHSFRFI